MYKIEIENNVTHQKYTYDNVEDKNNGKKLFYNFNLDTSNLDDGEYTLSLYDGNNLINTELLKIGDFNNKTIQYSKGANVFIDAKPDITLGALYISGGGIRKAKPNSGWDYVEAHNIIDCGLINYKMHNLPYDYFSSTQSSNTDWWGEYTSFDTHKVADFENFFINCPNLKFILIAVHSATNMNNMIDTPQNIRELYMTGLGCSFSYAPYTNIDIEFGLPLINYTVRNVQEVWDKEETPIIYLSKYLPMVDEDAIASAVNKGWLISGVNIFPEYSVNLNDQWRLSEEIPNPDPEQFDGVYESFSNWNVSNGAADMNIEIENYSDFTIYIRSDAESIFDYVDVYELDEEYTGNVYATTKSKQNSGTNIGVYQQVTFTKIPAGKHTIYIRYRKDGSGNQGTDRGYVLIPKH